MESAFSPVVLHMLLVGSIALRAQMEQQYLNRWTRKIHFQSMINVYTDILIIIRKIFALFLFTLNMETSRTFSNVSENFQKRKRKNFVANLINEFVRSIDDDEKQDIKYVEEQILSIVRIDETCWYHRRKTFHN